MTRLDPLVASLSLEKVLETIPSGLFVVDSGQRIVCWNAEAERITGYSAAEAIGQHCSFLSGIPCGKGCGLFDPLQQKPIIGTSCSIRHKDGGRVFLTKNVDYLRDEQGAIIGGIESFIDVSRQRRLETRLRSHSRRLGRAVRQRTAQLEEERSRLGMLLDSMEDLAYLVGPEFRISFTNRALQKVFGEVQGAICYQALHQRSSPCSWCPFERVRMGETVREERDVEINLRSYEIIHSPLRTVDGAIGKLAVYRDITARKLAEEKLIEANQELDAFVYTVSHDLRSPLTPIIGFAEFLREEYRDRLDAQGIELLTEIETQGQRMLALMEDLLTLSRVGRVTPPSAPLPLGPILQEVLNEQSLEINRLGLQVSVEELPELQLPATLVGELFTILLENAIRYAGAVDAGIEIGSRSAGERVRIFVRDHGPGVPEAERQRIFDPFYRGSTATGSRGTGIGLATVRKIARLYNGRCWVDETPGGGATFWIELPRHVT
ncbi:response receiver histidine kinase [Desulfuromonas sp. DDH964]|uniref:PAS domain-containing sensor histidine kinase n=1 Tax=Desulfuromonas sp. DDH964 TaxID=1823759 RepID=UPI00078B8F05|nr:PAS domain-containing sensor histidine kinase [Desulfuromonas sp. DDH964]AMV71149.1 response receiver histidine kinase [Desulfuromonas sp. DDH964]